MTTEEEKRWKFAQCFGDKGDSDDVTEGKRRTRRIAQFRHTN